MAHKSLATPRWHASLQTFIDAPNPASGPIPDDVAPFFSGPYYEWCAAAHAPAAAQLCCGVLLLLLLSIGRSAVLSRAPVGMDIPAAATNLSIVRRWNANRDAEGRWSYEGWQRSVKAIERALAEQGGLRGFDGLMGFSQVGFVESWGREAWLTNAELCPCPRLPAYHTPFTVPAPVELVAAHPPLPSCQGGAITSLAIGMQRSGFALKGLPPLRFCVCFAGIRCAEAGAGYACVARDGHLLPGMSTSLEQAS